MHLLVDPGLLPPPLNFYEASWFVPHRMDAPDRHNEPRQRNERTDGRRDASVRLLDGSLTLMGEQKTPVAKRGEVCMYVFNLLKNTS